MSMPVDLVLVRHGESEGNVAQARSRAGDNSAWTEEFKARHTCKYRLTDTGRAQARVAGDWVRKHITDRFDRYYCSEFARAKETAALMEMPDSRWILDFYLRERDKGVLGGHSHAERGELYEDEMRFRKTDALYWCPPGGESVANACLRVDEVLKELDQRSSGLRVLIVCHGNIMAGFRIRIEELTQEQYYDMEERASNDPAEKVQNGGILWYSRRNPNTGEVEPEFRWLRRVCPWKRSWTHGWERFNPALFTSEQLLQQVTDIPQLVFNDEDVATDESVGTPLISLEGDH
eukprot:TRINITY_DN3406_c1_g1_i1.p1 TRINITY_DN3406_c1_g1~~TRINITY_DN3406_c1_g1_i1.p1  ORF type:complete len:316 (-),score=96.65 TRINITY_DN3406_c1_g1_i1:602-1474(-)